MSLSDAEGILIRSLVSTPPEMTLGEFCARWPIEPTGVSALAGSMLNRALAERDPAAVRWGFALAKYCGTAVEHLSTIVALATESWHRSHEYVVFFLAELRRPELLPVFTSLVNARFEYLAWDDARALAVKCIWGIGKLGSEEAVAALAGLLRASDPIVSANARRQLERISIGGVDPRAAERARAVLSQAPPSEDDEWSQRRHRAPAHPAR